MQVSIKSIKEWVSRMYRLRLDARYVNQQQIRRLRAYMYTRLHLAWSLFQHDKKVKKKCSKTLNK